MCPFRIVLLLLGSLGLAAYMGSAVSAGGERPQGQSKRRKTNMVARRVVAWVATVLLVALHIDLLFSIGGTRRAFRYVMGTQTA
mmetsp:Transcript_112117/g.317553  ORF Transcript_112117/g.317553 Transcript_112117/m.317553 type:complete len:84 (+) Transcript_112117:66-317(+)